MIVDVLSRLAQAVEKAVADGYYRDFADAHAGGAVAPPLVAAVRRDAPWAFLAEAKPASPSRGDLSGGDAVGRARQRIRTYREYGVSGISVLTERDTFHGSLDLLADAARPGDTPVLMKDFIVHDDQLDAARAAGASAVLLIHHLFARGKTAWELSEAIQAAHDRGLEVLLEVDEGRAFEHAVTTEADLIGINNRDLRTLHMDKDRATEILRHRLHLVADRPVLALSGIEHRADVEAMHEGGATGILVGTALMESARPRDLLRELRGLPHVKCCGNGDPADTPDVLAALSMADAVGCVVHAGGAARERTLDEAAALFAALPADVERVLVTTNTDPVWLDEAVQATKADAVQLHRAADVATLAALRAVIGPERRLLAVIQPRTGHAEADDVQATVEAVRNALQIADRVVLDARPLPGEDAGGTGRRLDWAFARHVVDMLRPAPVILAGGIDPANVRDALRQVRPWGVDVSSGIETATKGRKDAERIRALCQNARRVLNLHDPIIRPDHLRVL